VIKLKKDDLEEYLNSKELDSKMEGRLRFTLIYKNLLYFSILIILFIMSLIFVRKVYLFSSIFTNINIIILIIYFTSFIISIILLGYLLMHIYQSWKTKVEWKKLSYSKNKRLDITIFIFSWISILLFIVTFIITPCTISGSSMEDTYQDGDKILCSHIYFDINNNDIIIFDASNYSYSQKPELYIKRAVAVEYDVLRFTNNSLYVNDILVCEELDNYQFLNIIGSEKKDDLYKEFIVPKDMIVAIGDNRINSYDSRSFGMINMDDLYGKVIFPVRGYN